MMYTDSEQSAIDILNAMNMKTKIPEENKRESGQRLSGDNLLSQDNKAIRRETRYEKWKRSRKSTSKWRFCCFF